MESIAKYSYTSNLMKVINHCLIIAQKSKSDYYKRMQFLNSVQRIEIYIRPLIKNNAPESKVKSVVAMFRKDLENLLPYPDNEQRKQIEEQLNKLIK